jgi:hypothetical protein
MSAALLRPDTLFARVTQLRELLRIVAEVRDLGNPLASPDQFRKLVALVVRIGLLFGLDPALLAKWQTIIGDDDFIAAVVSAVRYFLRLRGAV